MSIIASSSHGDPDSRSLQMLLEAFGSRFSLDDITAAYCQASQDVDVAGEILFAMTEKTPQCDQVNMKKETLKPSHVYVPKKVQGHEDSKAKVWRAKKNSISVGTVTGAIGKEYVRTRPLLNPPREATKPMNIDSRDIPEAVIWSHEMPQSNKANLSRAPPDVEEFIVKMLSEGFQVSEDVIHQVLGVCGYDVTKSTEKLIGFSDTKKYADVGISNEFTSKVDPQRQGSTSGDQVELQEFSQSDGARILTSSQKGVNAKTGLEKEVLEALFSGTPRYEEEPKLTRRFGERRARVAGRPVFKPLEDPFQERVVDVKQSSHTSKEDEDDENEFKAHRKAVHEHWNQMKEYYGAAAEAFFKGEPERARRLMEKGHFFGEKAREADDKSIAKMIDVKKDDDSTFEEDEVVRVNLNEHEAKEALRLLKHQFICFSGISSFKYLRVILADNKENSKSKRRHITKLLEGESIAWSEEDNGLVMMIRVDKIDPKKLSFAKK